MALPKRRISTSRAGKRQAHQALSAPALSTCKRCSQAKRPHTVCPNCGHYAGKEVLKVEESAK